ncbi:MAG: S-adenosylmethionine:tRNA ribosyltransferase-isomerase, partial [Clostridiaceae bacterium]|nr:S-adenosylmethionine:tRNA ribosyltransferase-isomerase [Clostridiaceae bacterium]
YPAKENLQAEFGETDIFIYPGYYFRLIDGLITNFHLPESTLLMLVSALMGREEMLAVYQEAIALDYRFFSFGDAMLLLPQGLPPESDKTSEDK